MKTAIIRSIWMKSYGYRLDCQPYLSGGLEAKLLLEQFPLRKDKLSDVTTAIYHAGRESRLWVDSPEFGVPFISGSDLRKADLHDLPLMSKRQIALTPEFIVRSGYTLITRSGTIGRMAFARRDMNGMACSEHVLRVVADATRILPGYMYAYLASRFGLPLVVSGTYGSMIQSIEPEHIASIPVPRLGDAIENEIHQLIEQASEVRSRASECKQLAISMFLKLCDLPELKRPLDYPTPRLGCAKDVDLAERMDSTYYIPSCVEARTEFDRAGRQLGSRFLSEVAEVFIPTIFKRQYADDPAEGYPYITGADVFCIMPTSTQYLMRNVALENRLLLKTGMIVLHEAGQRYGLIGRAVMVGRTLAGFACTNNMVRVTPHNPGDAGYIFSVLSSEHGIRLLKREAAGSSIPHLDARRVANIKIPWPDTLIRTQVGALAHEARENWDLADELEREADLKLVDALTRTVN